jgi:hypothetical protein
MKFAFAVVVLLVSVLFCAFGRREIVVLENGSGKSARSAETGRAGTTSVNKSGKAVIRAIHRKHSLREDHSQILGGRGSTKPAFELTGNVLTRQGVAIAGAVLTGSDGGTTVSTDASGYFELPSSISLIPELEVQHDDYLTTSLQQVAVTSSPLVINLEEKQVVAVSCRAVDYKTHLPVTKLSVSAPELQLNSEGANQGRFVLLDSREQGSYKVTLSAPGYITQPFTIYVPERGSKPVEQMLAMGPGAKVSGQVVEVDTRKPVPGIPINIERRGPDAGDFTTQTVTDSNGMFSFVELLPGPSELRVKPKAPLAEVIEPAMLRHGSELDIGRIFVGASGGIEGRLVRVPGSIPVSGETIRLYGTGTHSTMKTDGYGSFYFPNLAMGRYMLSAESSRLTEAVTVEPGEISEVTLRLGSGSLKGLVLENGKPFKAHIQLSRESGGQIVAQAQARDDGKFTVKNLSPGHYEAVLFLTDQRGYSPRVKESFEMPESGDYEHTFIIPSGAITGKVVDEEGKSVPGAMVLKIVQDPGTAFKSVPVPTDTALTGPDGTFRMENQQPGKYAVTARKEGLGMAKIVEVTVPDSGDSRPVLLKAGSRETGALVSTALNFSDGKPIPDAWCLLTTPYGRMGHGQHRGSDGVMRIGQLPVGKYHVRVSANAFSVGEHDVEIKPGQTTEITDVLYETGALRWTLTDANGAGIAGISCKLVPSDPTSIENPRSGVTDSSGLWTARGLSPGAYVGTAVGPNGHSVTLTLTILPAQLSAERTVLK